MEPQAFEVYRHFKGNLYQIITLAEDSENGNTLVIYQALYEPFKVYARPLDMFTEKIDRMKYPNATQEYRFEKVNLKMQELTTKVNQNIPNVKEEYIEGTIQEKCVQEPCACGPTENNGINPELMRFLEAESPEEKLNVLYEIKNKITPQSMTSMELSQGMEPQEEWSIEDRYRHLKENIITKQKYERSRNC